MIKAKNAIFAFLPLIAAAFTACSDAEQTINTADTAESVNVVTNETAIYQASEDYVKPLGRTFFEDGLLWCAYSGSGAEFSFTGTKCDVTIRGDSVSESGSDGNFARVGIYVNGERVVDDMIKEREKTYTVFESDSEEQAEVSIVKLSETAMSCLAVKEIAVTGSKIAPTAQKDLFIEFVGDSITCGYGVDDEDKDHHFSTATEDVTKAYAYRTAKVLGADYSMVSISGYGIISGYTDDAKISAQTIPQYYGKLGFSYGGFENGKPQNYDWDFSRREPDAIVINLGTNDDSYCKDDKDRQTEYKDGYVDFLKAVREKNPNAKIVCALGIMGDRLFPVVESAAAEYSEQTGDTNIYTVHLTPQSPSDGYAADWHPTSATHIKASEKMAEELKKILEIE